MSLHLSPVPAFEQVHDLAAHLRYTGTRIAVGTEYNYDREVELAAVIVAYLVDDAGQDWYGIYDYDRDDDDALVTDSFEVACDLMKSLADQISPGGDWDFEQVSPRPVLRRSRRSVETPITSSRESAPVPSDGGPR